MLQRRGAMVRILATLGCLSLLGGTAAVQAQEGSAATAAPAASTPKQIRKAQRKAARTRKNAELKTLEKGGYQPGQDTADYPQSLQNAEHKTVPQSPAGASSASH
ncbi:DUF4148 domain-containing protein [Paraburkholderia acidipaludis]|uniref:DUF4148 domain-containing protein n=1 Tax=Paraburkholderia acidipaludis TaxID=660537 RepID=UPI000ADFCAD9|nr:DUF4148 domain-containing protein [Paraburkholderia acidipaludis]